MIIMIIIIIVIVILVVIIMIDADAAMPAFVERTRTSARKRRLENPPTHHDV